MFWSENENLNVLIYNILEARKLKLITLSEWLKRQSRKRGIENQISNKFSIVELGVNSSLYLFIVLSVFPKKQVDTD